MRYRYTWITPLAISPVAPHAIYLGAQVLFRSPDDGDHWDVVSPDLSGKVPTQPATARRPRAGGAPAPAASA